jgi:hypothetical protein
MSTWPTDVRRTRLLADIISSGALSVVRLTEVSRQPAQSHLFGMARPRRLTGILAAWLLTHPVNWMVEKVPLINYST